MSARRKARKRALDILFEADLRGTDAGLLLQERTEVADPAVPDYAQTLVTGVLTHQAEIDRLIEEHARDWTLPRLPGVDRALLRIAAFELLHCPDVPTAVAINEAVELAKSLSTDESATFVNGLLGALVRVEVVPNAGAREASEG